MLKIDDITIKNFCGYDGEYTIPFNKRANVIFGPNGFGKSNLLKAIRIITSKKISEKRDNFLISSDDGDIKDIEPNKLALKKYVFDKDFDTTYSFINKLKNNLSLSSNMTLRNGEIIKSHIEYNDKEDCLILNNSELPNIVCSNFIDADSKIVTRSFQLEEELKDKFIEMAELVYGYPCKLETGVEEDETDEEGNILKTHLIYTDLVIKKEKNVKVHYKSMSDGEKKIATLLSNLCCLEKNEKFDLILIDNIALHVYMSRHANMISKILSSFKNKQFIFTTHSFDIINYMNDIYGESSIIDLEKIKTGKTSINL